MIRLTSNCNQNCILCGQWGNSGVFRKTGAQNPPQELDTQRWKKFISEISEFKPYLIFTGGEPLLRDDIIELINQANSCQMLSHLNSNATKLKERAKELVAANLFFISCSLDAPNEPINEKITGKQNTFNQVVTGIMELIEWRQKLKASLPVVQLFTTINIYNQFYLFEIAQLVASLKADQFVICFPVFTTAGLKKATEEIFQKEFQQGANFWNGFIHDFSEIKPEIIVDQIKKIKKMKNRFIFRLIPKISDSSAISLYFERPDVLIKNNKCSLPWSLATILPNGDVSTCWDHPDYIIGNLLNNKFSEIWYGDKIQKFRSILKSGLFPTCPRCTGIFL